ncbi:hypothetical protein [Paenibacillus sp. y28]|uniref:hypothetical protein n=1 Tax=Paenibacillus sp. y28 TaxID=3129110 RepID=UPI00301619F9
MSKNKKVWIVAVAVMGVALLLIVYQMLNGMGVEGEQRHKMGTISGIFKTLGTISVFLAAGSFWWIWFKKQRKSPSSFIRGMGKLLHRLHEPLGWLALLLVVFHGGYYLITDFQNRDTYSGIAAFLILLAIGGYGFFIQNIRNQWMRVIHRTLSIAWVPALIIHAGGSAFMATLLTLMVGVLVWVFGKKKVQQVG